VKVALTTHLRTQISALKPQTSNLKSLPPCHFERSEAESRNLPGTMLPAISGRYVSRHTANLSFIVYRLSSIICRLIISILPLPHLCYNN
jgi:hypothetical protein